MLKSLDTQGSEYELITVDNTKNAFSSAASALNDAGRRASGKYIVFVHQDVDLKSTSWLGSTEEILDSIPNLGIAGVAGMSECGDGRWDGIRSNITHRDPPRKLPGRPIQEPERVQTLDECLVVIPKAVFAVLPFDDVVCDDWHLYAVDYCLCVRKKLHLDVYVIPMSLHHGGSVRLSSSRIHNLVLGGLPRTYYQTLRRLLRKHRRHYGQIRTTCGVWSTSCPLVLQRPLSLARRALSYLWERFKRGMHVASRR